MQWRKTGKAEIRVDTLVQRDRFLSYLSYDLLFSHEGWEHEQMDHFETDLKTFVNEPIRCTHNCSPLS